MKQHPKIRVDLSSDLPALRQIIEGMRVLLVEGHLVPGAELPSVRRLAMDLGVHFNTVAEAYRQLASEGWLEQKHGRGAVVIERSAPVAVAESTLTDFRGRLRALVAQVRSQGITGAGIATELRAMADLVSTKTEAAR